MIVKSLLMLNAELIVVVDYFFASKILHYAKNLCHCHLIFIAFMLNKQPEITKKLRPDRIKIYTGLDLATWLESVIFTVYITHYYKYHRVQE